MAGGAAILNFLVCDQFAHGIDGRIDWQLLSWGTFRLYTCPDATSYTTASTPPTDVSTAQYTRPSSGVPVCEDVSAYRFSFCRPHVTPRQGSYDGAARNTQYAHVGGKPGSGGLTGLNDHCYEG